MRFVNGAPEVTPLGAKWLLDGQLPYERIDDTVIKVQGELQIKFGPIEFGDQIKVTLTWADTATNEPMIHIWEGQAFANTTIHVHGLDGWKVRFGEENDSEVTPD